MLFWKFAIPESLMQSKIKELLSDDRGLNTQISIKNLHKGLFFSISTEQIKLIKDGITVISVDDIYSRFKPLSLLNREIVFLIEGKICSGELHGFFTLQGNGFIKIRDAEISEIPILRSNGFVIKGNMTAEVLFKRDMLETKFESPEIEINSPLINIPVPFKTAHSIYGILNIEKGVLNITSISLETDHGYARIKGNIKNGFMDLILELMPDLEKLTKTEIMLLQNYEVSPGYYMIPVKGNFSL
jgi:type II secretion system protein N